MHSRMQLFRDAQQRMNQFVPITDCPQLPSCQAVQVLQVARKSWPKSCKDAQVCAGLAANLRLSAFDLLIACPTSDEKSFFPLSNSFSLRFSSCLLLVSSVVTFPLPLTKFPCGHFVVYLLWSFACSTCVCVTCFLLTTTWSSFIFHLKMFYCFYFILSLFTLQVSFWYQLQYRFASSFERRRPGLVVERKRWHYQQINIRPGDVITE